MNEIEDVAVSDAATAQVQENNKVQIIDDVVEKTTKLFPAQHMFCNVHTEQLAIRDGLQDRHAATLIAS